MMGDAVSTKRLSRAGIFILKKRNRDVKIPGFEQKYIGNTKQILEFEH